MTRFVMICMATALAACSASEPAQDTPPAANVGEVTMTSPTPIVSTTVDELIAAYAANEVAAQQTFSAGPVEMTGTVRGIVLDTTDDPVILFESGQKRPVQALFNKENGGATASLNKGAKATVVCDEIREIMGLPILDECRLAQK